MKNYLLIAITIFIFGNNLIAEEKTLTQLLKEKADSISIPFEKREIMKSALDDLSISKIEEKAIKVGEKIPNFTLKNYKGETINLYEKLKKGPIVLTFYRGGWCPYCNIQLHFYQKSIEDFRKYKGNLIAISPETPDNTIKTVKRNEIQYEVVSDLNNEYAKKLNLVFELNPKLIELYKSFGVNLKENQGNNDWELPLSATYVINKEAIITYSFVNVNYKFRADVSEIVEALSKLS